MELWGLVHITTWQFLQRAEVLTNNDLLGLLQVKCTQELGNVFRRISNALGLPTWIFVLEGGLSKTVEARMVLSKGNIIM